MKGKLRGVVILLLSLSVISSTVVLINYDQKYRAGYLLDKPVPGIVKGTAKMVDTEAYFTKHELQQSSIKLDLVCNNSANLEISLGYKSPNEPLMKANHLIKEKMIWSKNHNSLDRSVSDKRDRLTMDSNLSTFGFTNEEYVKADERIYYLRIIDISGGPYGYEKNITTEINGTFYETPEYIPNIHYIEEFRLSFDNLIFETMLYPFFDGSTEIIIPIRGVNHELALEDAATEYEIKGKGTSSFSTTTPGTGSSSMWAVIFGTSNFKYVLSDKLDYPPIECRSFILGCVRSSAPDEYKAGILDYGWCVTYCMDGNSTQTDDNNLENMLTYADSQLGLTGKLIVFANSHGIKWGGNHYTMTGTSHNILGLWWTNVVKLSEYENLIDDITSESTKVLLWIAACKGYGLDSFASGDHNECLESWSFREKHYMNVYGDSYSNYCWGHDVISGGTVVVPKDEMAFFFSVAYEGTCQVTVTDIGPDIKDWYDDKYDSEDEESVMYIQSTWGTYTFYINWGY